MKPTFVFWGWVLPSWHVMYIVAALASWSLMLWLSRDRTAEFIREVRLMYSVCYVSGYFGARLFSIAFESQSPRWAEIFETGAMTMYGGLLGAILCGGSWLYGRCVPDKAVLFDLGMMGGLLAISIGRIGCFLNGDDFGVVSQAWYAVAFVSHASPETRVPIQLFESVVVFCIVMLGVRSWSFVQKNWGAGSLGLLLIAGYAGQRFINEFYRADPRGGFMFGYSPSQWVSIVCLICVLLSFIWKKLQRNRMDEKEG